MNILAAFAIGLAVGSIVVTICYFAWWLDKLEERREREFIQRMLFNRLSREVSAEQTGTEGLSGGENVTSPPLYLIEGGEHE